MTATRIALPRLRLALATTLLLAGLGGCDRARLEVAAGSGADPVLPKPDAPLLPTVNIAPAKGWASGGAPTPAPGLQVQAFAEGLDHPRWLLSLPNGDVLVAESNAPERPEDEAGFSGWIARQVMLRAGAVTTSADRISLLRDVDGDGAADQRTPFLEGLHSPFGMALVGDWLYVANTDALLRFPYHAGDLQITAAGEKVADLPAGPRNHHWTKNVIARPDGRKLYVTVGSNSNIAEHGLEAEAGRALILEIDAATGQTREFATGLRNPNGLAWQPVSGALWTTVNERDELGSDLVPDYMTSVQDGAFYGWPWSYYGPHVDTRVQPQRPEMVAKARVPDYALGPHTASLGLSFYERGLLPARYAGGAFIGQHGSWNRKPRSGYKVVFVTFANGQPAGPPEDVLTGFVDEDGKALGRPVGVVVDGRGALLVADDVGNRIWRLSASTP